MKPLYKKTLFISSLFLMIILTSCGTTQSISEDGIYAYDSEIKKREPITEHIRKKEKYTNNQFTKELERIENLKGADIITDIESYKSDHTREKRIYDQRKEEQTQITHNKPWGYNNSNEVVVSISPNFYGNRCHNSYYFGDCEPYWGSYHHNPYRWRNYGYNYGYYYNNYYYRNPGFYYGYNYYYPSYYRYGHYSPYYYRNIGYYNSYYKRGANPYRSSTEPQRRRTYGRRDNSHSTTTSSERRTYTPKRNQTYNNSNRKEYSSRRTYTPRQTNTPNTTNSQSRRTYNPNRTSSYNNSNSGNHRTYSPERRTYSPRSSSGTSRGSSSGSSKRYGRR